MYSRKKFDVCALRWRTSNTQQPTHCSMHVPNRSGFHFSSVPWRIKPGRFRTAAFQLLRLCIRIRRATQASAVLVAVDQRGRVLALPDPFGKFSLPSTDISGWTPISDQVSAWAAEILGGKIGPTLLAIEGRCGTIAFVYGVKLGEPSPPAQGYCWTLADTVGVDLDRDKIKRVISARDVA